MANAVFDKEPAMKRFGTPIKMPPTKEIPGPGWEISEETMRELEKIEENSRRAMLLAALQNSP